MLDFNFDWFRNVNGDNSLLGRNISWLLHYLQPAGIVNGGNGDLLEKSRKVISVYQAMNMAQNQYSWAYLFDRLEKFPIAIDFFMEGCNSEIVVGYELSRAQKRVLNDAGKTYIDLRTHPIRFLSDYHLSAGTNRDDIHRRLVSLAPSREYIQTHVAMHKARAARRYQRRLDPDNGVVFFAQTAFDSSRIRNGEMLDDAFVIDALTQYIAKENPKNIYYKSHPHEPISQALEESLKKMKAKETKTPSYDMLSVEGLRVCALSSSICHEAEYFGANPVLFHPPSEKFSIADDKAETGEYIMLPANLYSGSIWRYLTSGGELPEVYYPIPATPYRMASGLSWG